VGHASLADRNGDGGGGSGVATIRQDPRREIDRHRRRRTALVVAFASVMYRSFCCAYDNALGIPSL
jgi:hypothetical protein